MSKAYNRIRRFCAWCVGIVFVLSGVLKLMDPVGAGLVMESYFKFLHLGFLNFSAKALGTAFALAETVVGAGLVTGVWRKTFAFAATLLMGLFTILTVLLAIFNPSMDCGCFGEIAHLTHAQSLLKNLVLDLLLAIAFLPFRNLGVPRKAKYASFLLVSLSAVAFMTYSLLFLPLKEYTSYREGAMILAALPDGGESLFQASFVYEKDGETMTITLDDELPDSSWTFVRSETTPNEEVERMPVLPISRDGEILDDMATDGNVMVISTYKPARRQGSKKDEAMKEHVRRTAADAAEAGFTVLRLSIAPDEEDGEFRSDLRSLAGLNRSNGGVTLIQDGVIVRKWARRNAPDLEEFQALATAEQEETLLESQSRGALLFQAYLLYTFAILLLL